MNQDKAKVLYVTGALDSPPHIGCMIRTLNICRQIKQDFQITVVGVSRRLNQESVCYCQNEFERFYPVTIRDYDAYRKPWGNMLHKWHIHWPSSPGPQVDPSDQAMFDDLVSSHDVVWFHSLYAANPFKFNKRIASVIDIDDLNSCKYLQRSKYEKNIRFSLSAKVQAYRWRKAEFNTMKKFSRVVVCSDEDKKYLGDSERIRIIPNGFICPSEKPVWKTPDASRIGFIGCLNYLPNRDGLIWFRDKVWPLIQKQKPEMKLRLIGSLPKTLNKVEAEGFEYLGYVEDTTQEMQTWSSIVVPILYAGGTRIKIIDAFSKMCPVVSTQVGAHGIRATHEKDIFLADAPTGFARHCLDQSDSPQKAESIAQNGWKLFTEMYTWDVIGVSIREIIRNLTKNTDC
jgi:glycosyltransferase involved in cell wall biosynthesis